MSVSGPIAEQAPRRPTRQVPVRRVLSALLSVAIVVGIFSFFLPQFADISSVWSAIADMTPLEVGSLAVAAVWNLATYGFVMLTTMPGLTYPQAMVVTESSTAVSNTLPGGGAIGIGMNFSMYTSWGFSQSRATVSLLLSGIWNNFAKLGLPVLALALVSLQGSPSSGRVIAGIAGIAGLIAAIVVFALMLQSEAGARRFGEVAGAAASALLRLIRRPPVHGWELATVKFRARTIRLLRARWYWLTLATIVSHLSLYVVLLMSLRAVGVSNSDVGWAEVLAVFSFARLITAIPLTPGGLGIVELALITGLSAAGGDRAEVTAAVLVFRALTYVLPIPLGLATYIFWRRNTSWRRPPGAAPRTPLVPETDSAAADPAAAHAADPPAPDAAPPAPARRSARGQPIVRCRRDVVWLLGSALVLALTAMGVHQHAVDSWERVLFRVANDHTALPFVVVWPIMQLGNILAVPVCAAIAAATRRFRLCATILLGGALTYYLAKVIKHYVIRGRPVELLNDVSIRGTASQGLGYVSGHAGVVAGLAMMTTPYLGRRARIVVCALAVAVCLARLYVGAHLPLDVLGGAALGLAVGAGMRLVLGRPGPCP